MKLNRFTGFGSLAAIALSVALPYTTSADPSRAADTSGNTAHRVIHSLASNEAYTRATGAGYKWGQRTTQTDRASTWADSLAGQTGYKWGNAAAPLNTTAAKNFAEQSANRWARRDFSEQAANRWARR